MASDLRLYVFIGLRVCVGLLAQVTAAQLRALPRFKLHMLTDIMPQILDARITKVGTSATR